MTAPYPWQRDQWQRLARAQEQGQLPHALLLTAPVGTGLGAFARRWACATLCRSGDPAERPCGRCRACEQAEAGTHPDLVQLVPDEAGKAIGIDAVRGLIERLGLTAATGGKVALIDPADSLTAAAGNSLLKTLEEPPGASVILLVCHRPSRLPATVRSRCQRVSFGLPQRQAALEWLQGRGVERPEYWLGRAGGAPLAAEALARSDADPEALVVGLLETLERGATPPSLVAEAAGYPLATTVPLFSSVVADLLRVRMAGADCARLQNGEHAARIARTASRLDVRALFHYLDALNRAVPGPSSSLRPDMQIQGLLADAAALRQSRRGPSGEG